MTVEPQRPPWADLDTREWPTYEREVWNQDDVPPLPERDRDDVAQLRADLVRVNTEHGWIGDLSPTWRTLPTGIYRKIVVGLQEL